MKLLEKLGEVRSGTLCACWTVARRNLHETDEHYLDELAIQLGGIEKLQAVLDEIFASAPSSQELEMMITNFREKGVEVDSWEFDEEIKAGLIETSPLIETLVREAEERRQALQREDDEVKKPLPREESLSAFFEDLGIANFIIGGGIGAYGWDWGHIGLSELDQVAKKDSFSKYLEEGHYLEHTTKGKEPFSTPPILSEASDRDAPFGELERPWFQATDGTRYTFLHAKYRDGHFFVKTRVEKEGAEPTEASYSLQELRDMIGELPPPLAKPSWLRRKVASLFQ